MNTTEELWTLLNERESDEARELRERPAKRKLLGLAAGGGVALCGVVMSANGVPLPVLVSFLLLAYILWHRSKGIPVVLGGPDAWAHYDQLAFHARLAWAQDAGIHSGLTENLHRLLLAQDGKLTQRQYRLLASAAERGVPDVAWARRAH